jgi:malonyl-CoA decarboxylase
MLSACFPLFLLTRDSLFLQLLQTEFRNLDTFVTLSPIPRFRKWLEAKVVQNEEGHPFYDGTILLEKDIKRLAESGIISSSAATSNSPQHALSELLTKIDTAEGLQEHAAGNDVVKETLSRLVARYLCVEKHRRKPLDAVAGFHVSNGAQVYRVNFAADLSRKGMQNSFGMMVNYRYNLTALAENQKEFERDFCIPVSPEVSKWLPLSQSKL